MVKGLTDANEGGNLPVFVAPKARMSGSPLACREHLVYLRVGGIASDQIEQLRLCETCIFEPSKRRPGGNGFAFGVVTRHGQDNRIGKARQANGLQLAHTQAELIQPGELENRFVGHTHLHKTGDSVTGIEWGTAAAENLDNRDASLVGKASLFGFDDLGDFIVGDMQRAKLLNGAEHQPSSVERRCVQGPKAMTGGNAERHCESKNQTCLPRARGWCTPVRLRASKRRAISHDFILPGRETAEQGCRGRITRLGGRFRH